MTEKYSCSLTCDNATLVLKQAQFRAASILSQLDLCEPAVYSSQSRNPSLDPIWDFVCDGIQRDCSISSDSDASTKAKLIVLFSILYPDALEQCTDDKILQKDFYNYYLEEAAEAYLRSTTGNTLLEPLRLSRIDIKNSGGETNTVEVKSCTDKNFNVTSPSFLADDKGKGISFTSSSDDISFVLQCVHDGELTLNFRTLDLRDSNRERIKFLIDYKDIKVLDAQSTVLFSADGYSTTHHNHPKEITLPVHDAQELTVSFARKFNYETKKDRTRLADALFTVDLKSVFN